VTVLDLESIPAALRFTRDHALARIEDASLTASQPREQAFFDGWLMRYANGKAKRARSVNLVAAGERPLEDKLRYCTEFFAHHRLPLIFRITPFSQPRDVDGALARAGYVASEDTRVMVLGLDGLKPVRCPDLSLVELDGDAFGATLASLHGLDAQRGAVERDRYARSPVPGIYVAMVDGGRAVACGSAALDGDLVGIYGMVTGAEARGRGLATAIVNALLLRAARRGCVTAYLQVEAGNVPARHVYSKFGFRDGYAYWYRRPPGEGNG